MKREYSEYINFVIGNAESLTFNLKNNAFEISDFNLSWENLISLNDPLKRMRLNRPPEGLFCTKVKEINLGFYDKYLEDYCSDRLEDNIPIAKTDLVSKGDKIHVLGRIASDLIFSDDQKILYLKSLKNSDNKLQKTIYRLHAKNKLELSNLYTTDEGWILCFLDDPIIYSSGLSGSLQILREKLKKLLQYDSEDRVLGVIENIRKKGWDKGLTWKPHIGSSEIQGSIIGYSSKSSTHSLITGRHRITAAVYLHKKGELNGEIILDYPRVIYPWKTWVYDNI